MTTLSSKTEFNYDYVEYFLQGVESGETTDFFSRIPLVTKHFVENGKWLSVRLAQVERYFQVQRMLIEAKSEFSSNKLTKGVKLLQKALHIEGRRHEITAIVSKTIFRQRKSPGLLLFKDKNVPISEKCKALNIGIVFCEALNAGIAFCQKHWPNQKWLENNATQVERYFQVQRALFKAKSEFRSNKLTEGVKLLRKAFNIEGQRHEITAIVSTTIFQLRKNQKNLRLLLFKDKNVPISEKSKALNAGIAFCQKHWSNQILLEINATYGSWDTLQTIYHGFLKMQAERGTHPGNEENPRHIQLVVKSFLDIFKYAPQDKKKYLATNPLVPNGTKFKSGSVQWATPLNYICSTANIEALDAIIPYLSPEDWNQPSPKNSTLIHCIIAGMDKLHSKMTGNPIKCLKRVLSINPTLRTKSNAQGITPQEYLSKHVIPNLKRNRQKYFGKGGHGFNGPRGIWDPLGRTHYSVMDNDFKFMIGHAEKIVEILKSNE